MRSASSIWRPYDPQSLCDAGEPDAHEEYQRRHNPIWPELEAVLKAHGAHHYAIYLDKERHLLFATVEIESEERWKRSPAPKSASAGGNICAR
jgi:L-rhamnose mutarotase